MNDSSSLFMSSSEAEDNDAAKSKLFFHKDEHKLIHERKTQIRSVAIDTRSEVAAPRTEAVVPKRTVKRKNSAQRPKKESNQEAQQGESSVNLEPVEQKPMTIKTFKKLKRQIESASELPPVNF